jgi:hypothetical protein
MIELAIKNRYGFTVITQHETQASADSQRRLSTNEPVEVKPTFRPMAVRTLSDLPRKRRKMKW